MPLIEGIGDEVTHFFIGLIVVVIVTLAWWTTSISEQRHVQTVWLLDRRRHRAHRRLTNHTHSVTITAGLIESPPIQPENPPPVVETVPKPPEASTSTTGVSNSDTSTTEERSEEDERDRIVQTMDADACVVRQRRLAFYNRNSDDNVNENYTVNHTVMEHNYAEAASSLEESEVKEQTPKEEADITIKLKYINDDLRLVSGKLQEQLGDFKKRHFQPELSSNKLVRLIFNGQVLQQDHKTLEGCGLFDNCVVHCLIHQRRTTAGDETTSEARNDQLHSNRRNTNQNNNNNNNQGRDWDLGNFLFAIISFTLLSAWYFRYVYAHLYTVTATVGLILMTGVFTIVLFGFYFPDQEHIPQRMENAPGTQS